MQFLNCNGTDRLVPSAYYRVTFATGSVAGALLTDGGADRALQNAYNSIQHSTDLVPTTSYSRAPNERTVVVDCKATIHAKETVAQAANIINGADLLVDVISVELLRSAPDLVTAPAERQAIITETDTARPSVLSGISAPLAAAGDTVKWVAIAAGVILCALLIKDVEEWL